MQPVAEVFRDSFIQASAESAEQSVIIPAGTLVFSNNGTVTQTIGESTKEYSLKAGTILSPGVELKTVSASFEDGGDSVIELTLDNNSPQWINSSGSWSTADKRYRVKSFSGTDVDETDDGNSGMGYRYSLTLEELKATVTTAPQAISGLEYTGSAQALVTAGAAENGTMYYALGRFEKRNTEAAYNPAVGDVIKPDGQYGVSFPAEYSISIGEKTYTNSDNYYHCGIGFFLSYDKTEKHVQFSQGDSDIEAAWGNHDAFKVTAVDTENKNVTIEFVDFKDGWSTEIPKATEAGEYKVSYMAVGDGIYGDTDPVCITATIANAPAKVITAPAANNTAGCDHIVFDAASHDLVTAGEADTSMQYALGKFEERNIKQAYYPAVGDVIKPSGFSGVYFPSGYSITIGQNSYSGTGTSDGINLWLGSGNRVSWSSDDQAIIAAWGDNDAFKVTAVDTANKNVTIEFVDFATAVNTAWSPKIPKASKRGTYNVSYRAAADDTHGASAVGTVAVTIAGGTDTYRFYDINDSGKITRVVGENEEETVTFSEGDILKAGTVFEVRSPSHGDLCVTLINGYHNDNDEPITGVFDPKTYVLTEDYYVNSYNFEDNSIYTGVDHFYLYLTPVRERIAVDIDEVAAPFITSKISNEKAVGEDNIFIAGKPVEIVSKASLDIVNADGIPVDELDPEGYNSGSQTSGGVTTYTYSFTMPEEKLYISHTHTLNVINTSNSFSLGCKEDNAEKTLLCKIEAPEAETLVYNGAAHPATFTMNEVPASYSDRFEIVGTPAVVYKDADGNEITGLPTEAGKYTAEAVVDYKINNSTKVSTKTIKVVYTIAQKKIADDDVNIAIDPATKSYDGTAPEFVVTATYGDNTLVEDVDYTYTVTPDGADVNEYTITFTGAGNYTGTTTKTFTISNADVADQITFTAEDVEYSAVTYDANDNITLAAADGTQGTDMLEDNGTTETVEYYKVDLGKSTSNTAHDYSGTKFVAGKWLNIGVNYKASDVGRNDIIVPSTYLYNDPACTSLAFNSTKEVKEIKLNFDNSVEIDGNTEKKYYHKPGVTLVVNGLGNSSYSHVQLRESTSYATVQDFIDEVGTKLDGTPTNAGDYVAKATLTNSNYATVTKYDNFTINKATITVTPNANIEFENGLVNTLSSADNVDAATAKAAALKAALIDKFTVSGYKGEDKTALEDTVNAAVTLDVTDSNWSGTLGYSKSNPTQVADSTVRYFLNAGEYNFKIIDPELDNYNIVVADNAKLTVAKLDASQLDRTGASVSDLSGFTYNGKSQKLDISVRGNRNVNGNTVVYPYIMASELNVNLYNGDTLVSMANGSAVTGCPKYMLTFLDAGTYTIKFEPTSDSVNLAPYVNKLNTFTVDQQTMAQVMSDVLSTTDSSTAEWIRSKECTGAPQTVTVDSIKYHGVTLLPGRDFTVTCTEQTNVNTLTDSITPNYQFTIEAKEGSNFKGSWTGDWEITPAMATSINGISLPALGKTFDGVAVTNPTAETLVTNNSALANHVKNNATSVTTQYFTFPTVEGTTFTADSVGKFLEKGVEYNFHGYRRLMYFYEYATGDNGSEFVTAGTPENRKIYVDSDGNLHEEFTSNSFGKIANTYYARPGMVWMIGKCDNSWVDIILVRPEGYTNGTYTQTDLSDSNTFTINGKGYENMSVSVTPTEAPTTAGLYIAKTTVSGSEFSSFDLSEAFEITKAPVTLTMTFIGDPWYSLNTNYGITHWVTVTGDVTGYKVSDADREQLVKIKDSDGNILLDDGYAPRGTYTYVVNEKVAAIYPNYTFTITNPTLTISEIPISSDVIEITGNTDNTYVYDGNPKTYVFTLTNRNTKYVLIENVDYTVTYKKDGVVVESPTDAGVYSVEIIAKEGSDYAENLSPKTLTINPAQLTDADVSVSNATSLFYNGSALSPTITVSKSGKTLVENTDYTVTYKDSTGAAVTEIKNAGEYTVEVTGIGNYGGKVTKSFEVFKAIPTITVTPNEHIVYDGAAVDLSDFTVTSTCTNTGDEMGAVTLEFYAADITTKLDAAPKDAGMYYVKATVAATANYWGASSELVPFTIERKPVTITLGHADITWGKLVSKSDLFTAEGFIADDPTVPEGAILESLFTAELNNTDFDFTDGSQNAVGTYTLAVIEANLNYYYTRPYNYTLTVTEGTLKVNPKTITADMITIDAESYEYDGTTHTPTVTVKTTYEKLESGSVTNVEYTLVKGTAADTDGKDYYVRGTTANSRVGTQPIYVTGVNNFTSGTKPVQKTWAITNGTLTVTVPEIGDKVYSGNAVAAPENVTVKNSSGADVTADIAWTLQKQTGENTWETVTEARDVGTYRYTASVTAANYYDAVSDPVEFKITRKTVTAILNDDDLTKPSGYKDGTVRVTFEGIVDGTEVEDTVNIGLGVANGTVITVDNAAFNKIKQQLGGNYELEVSGNPTVTIRAAEIARAEARTAYIKPDGSEFVDAYDYVVVYDENGDVVQNGYVLSGTDFTSMAGNFDITVTKDGKSVVCEWVVKDTIIAGHTLNLADVIGVNFFVDFTGMTIDDNTYVVFTTNRYGAVRIDASEGAVNGKYRVFTIPVAPAELSDTITCDVYVNGELCCSEDYKARQYCETIISREPANQFQINRRNTCIALLNYAAAAQTFFNHNTEDIANKYLTDNNITYTKTASVVDFYETLTDAYTKYWTAGDKATLLSDKGITDIEYKGTALNADASVTLRHVFSVKTGTVDQAIAKYKNIIAFNGANIECTIKKTSDTQFSIETSGINAVDLCKSDLCGFSIDGTVILDEYSINTYARSYKERQTASAQRNVDLVEAMYYYSCEANNMFS